MSNKRVVIVGVGCGGIRAAKVLAKDKSLQVTVVCANDYVEVPMAGLRSLMVPAEASMQFVPLRDCLPPNVTVVRGLASGVADGSVDVDGTPVPYDCLLICTGGKYANDSTAFLKSPANATSIAGRVEQFATHTAALVAAKNVKIIGSAIVGTELACEIAHYLPDKKVTVVGRSAVVLPGMSKKTQRVATSHLEKMGVTVELGTEVPAETAAEGADQVYNCTGFVPCTDFLKGGFLAGALNEQGYVNVGTDSRVAGHMNVFAFGDIIAPGHMTAPFTSGYVIDLAAPKVAANIQATLAGKRTKPLGKPPVKAGALVSLGPTAGVGNFDGMQMPGCIVTMLKSKDLFRKKMAKAWKV